MSRRSFGPDSERRELTVWTLAAPSSTWMRDQVGLHLQTLG
jgi:hypothetical protein